MCPECFIIPVLVLIPRKPLNSTARVHFTKIVVFAFSSLLTQAYAPSEASLLAASDNRGPEKSSNKVETEIKYIYILAKQHI